jgi:hypothetical protein
LEEEEEEEKKKKNRPINSSCQLTPEPHTNPNSFRHIQTSKDCYTYSILPKVYHTLESTAYNIYHGRHS